MKSLEDPNTPGIRVLKPSDAKAYRALRLMALHEEPPAFGSLPEAEPDISETAARLAPTDDRLFLGAFEDGKLVGVIRLSREPSPNENHRIYLGGLFVHPSFRRRGYGRGLVSAALGQARTTQGVVRVNLTVVTQQEAAILLYKSYGFRIYGTEEETFSKNGRFYDEHLMTLRFD